MSDLIYQYWGKAKKKDNGDMPDYHLLVYHCLDVAAVGWIIMNQKKHLCKKKKDFLNWLLLSRIGY